MAKARDRICKDCGPVPGHPHRPAPYPGPRCATHHRERKRATSKARHEAHVQRTYRGMGPGDYDRILEEQGGVCAICGLAKGITKRLAVDHDHFQDWPYGALCAVCNDYLAYIRRRAEVGLNLHRYLTDPPAWKVIGPPLDMREPPF